MPAEKPKRVTVWAPAIIWAAVILFFAVVPSRSLPSSPVENFDKAVHFLEYLILSILTVRSARSDMENFFTGPFPARFFLSGSKWPVVFQKGVYVFLFTLILCSAYGILVELIQYFTPTRSASLADAAANTAGVSFGLFLNTIWTGRRGVCRK